MIFSYLWKEPDRKCIDLLTMARRYSWSQVHSIHWSNFVSASTWASRLDHSWWFKKASSCKKKDRKISSYIISLGLNYRWIIRKWFKPPQQCDVYNFHVLCQHEWTTKKSATLSCLKMTLMLRGHLKATSLRNTSFLGELNCHWWMLRIGGAE